MKSIRPNRTAFRLAGAMFLFMGLALSVSGADVVILKDGFVIQGTVRKEMTSITDKASGQSFGMYKANGFDFVDEGPKVVIFSTHVKQLGEVNKEIRLRPEYKAYKTDPGQTGIDPLPAGAVTKSSTEFNDKWKRTIEVRVPQGWDRIDQQVTYLDPYFAYMVSTTHSWRATYRTSELDPQKVRKLLSTHPELIEKDGKPDAHKRIAIAKFMLDVGWLKLAKDDVEKVRKDFPGAIPKDAKEAFDSLVKEIDVATAGLVVKEAELAVNAGRYDRAGELLAVFPEKLAEPKQIGDVAKLKARWKIATERYKSGRRLLRNVLDEVTGLGGAQSTIAVGGGPIAAVWPHKRLTTSLAELVEAGETVYNELHPDSASRIEYFIGLASQVEQEKLRGRDPTKRPDELLATATSGWAKGKNGATPDTDLARNIWAARNIVLSYQRSNDLNTRNELLTKYRQLKPVPIDELAQVIGLLPPAEPENLLQRTGTPIPAVNGIPTDVYRRKTAPIPSHASGIPYFVKLPPEYHHGRAYPLLIVLTSPTVDAEQALGSLAYEAERNGYILVAPDWATQFAKGYTWNGEDHEYVTAVMRDAIRHFCVDNDRVFLFGAADGANMAMDVGMSHPDLFAGVLAMGPLPKWGNMFSNYWTNAQKLPVYVVTGELSGDSAANLRRIFSEWMPRGFPGLMVVYKGRGLEWYSAEVPIMFDWMSRKKRVGGAATLALGTNARQPWNTMRETDNRFYWLGVDGIARGRLIENVPPGRQVGPATITGDIKGNNRITLSTFGVTKLSVWLTQELIDWNKPVYVSLNGAAPRGYRGKVLEPDLKLLLDEYRERGDRRVLILGRLEFTAIP